MIPCVIVIAVILIVVAFSNHRVIPGVEIFRALLIGICIISAFFSIITPTHEYQQHNN